MTLRIITRSASLAVFLGLLGFAASCGDDDGVTTTDADTEFTCDPMGDDPAMGALLNAPVDSDVTVIVKDPQHPGDPGPDNLP